MTDINHLRAEVEKLKEELSIWKSVFPDIAPERVLPDRSKLEAENEKLRAALEPFAIALDGNWSHQPDDLAIDAGFGIDLRMRFTLGDFRRARAAVTKGEREG